MKRNHRVKRCPARDLKLVSNGKNPSIYHRWALRGT